MNFMQYYDEAAVRAALRTQIEHYFSKQNLVRDIFLRQRMDREGYIPCEMLFGFPRVRAMCFSIEFMLAAVADSEVLDVDVKNEKVRVTGSWKTWLFPSSDGTLGVPLYTKFPRQEEAANAAAVMMPEQRMKPVAETPLVGNSSDESTTDDESASDSAMSTPSTPTRSSARSTPSASPVPKASLSVDAAEWTPSF
jgi:la-related protein 1